MVEHEATPATGRVVVRVSLEPGDPPSGLIALDGGENATAFSGWVDLMTAITALRAQAGSLTGSS